MTSPLGSTVFGRQGHCIETLGIQSETPKEKDHHEYGRHLHPAELARPYPQHSHRDQED
jgi:hypothetical protein